MIATPILSRFHSNRVEFGWARERLENIQIHSGFEVEVIDDEKKTASAVATATFVAVALDFMARNAVFSLTHSLISFVIFGTPSASVFAKPRIPAFGNASSVLSQFNAFDTKRDGNGSKCLCKFEAIIDFATPKMNAN